MNADLVYGTIVYLLLAILIANVCKMMGVKGYLLVGVVAALVPAMICYTLIAH
jgi:hypothetical protein